MDETVEVQIGREGRVTQIGSLLNMDQKREMKRFLKDNFDVFTWSAVEMVDIFPSIINNSLNVNLIARPIKQKKEKVCLKFGESCETRN